LMIKFDKARKTELYSLPNRSIQFWQILEPNRGRS
jgi:hypothetical protein